MSTFDRFVFVDWSANSTPKTGKDSIWVAEASTGTDISLRNPSTRGAATRRVLGILRKAVEQRQRVLVGFDFAYSYPLAVLRHLASSHGPADFTDLWEVAHSRIQDSGDNSNDRYSFAAWANEHWFKEHYYWGFPSRSHAEPWLLGTRTDTKLPEFRLAESNSPGTQPTRKLAYSGSVGSQALLGMRRLYELRDDPALSSVSVVWPMETGFTLPKAAPGTALIVHAEIYPTLVVGLAKAAGVSMPASVTSSVNDAQQVWACAALAREEDRLGTLAMRFERPRSITTAEQEDQALREGWILWS